MYVCMYVRMYPFMKLIAMLVGITSDANACMHLIAMLVGIRNDMHVRSYEGMYIGN